MVYTFIENHILEVWIWRHRLPIKTNTIGVLNSHFSRASQNVATACIHDTEVQIAPEPRKKLLPAVLLTYFGWKQWMISSKTLGIRKFGARPWERPVKAKTLKFCSQGNKDETKFCLYRCTLYPKLFIGLPWTPVVNYFLNWSTVLDKITIWKSGKCQNLTEGRPFLMK